MIKGALFDFDGTLVDSMFIWYTFGEDYLRTLGKEPRENLTETFKTFTLEQAAEYYREHYGVTLSVGEIVDGVNEMVSEIYRTKVALKNGVLEFLRDLRSKGVKMCVATVTDRPIVEDVLKKLGIRDFFTEIFTCAEVGLSVTVATHIFTPLLRRSRRNSSTPFLSATLVLYISETISFTLSTISPTERVTPYCAL